MSEGNTPEPCVTSGSICQHLAREIKETLRRTNITDRHYKENILFRVPRTKTRDFIIEIAGKQGSVEVKGVYDDEKDALVEDLKVEISIKGLAEKLVEYSSKSAVDSLETLAKVKKFFPELLHEGSAREVPQSLDSGLALGVMKRAYQAAANEAGYGGVFSAAFEGALKRQRGTSERA